jgi:hypothetical protein
MKRFIILILMLFSVSMYSQDRNVGKSRESLISNLGPAVHVTQIDMPRGPYEQWTYETQSQVKQYQFGAGQYKDLVIANYTIFRYDTHDKAKKAYKKALQNLKSNNDFKSIESTFGEKFESEKYFVVVYYIDDYETTSFTVVTELK